MNFRQLICISVLLLCAGLKAQQAENWLPALASADGTNEYKGVEAYYSIGKCGNEEMLFIKLVNKNSNTINARWKASLITIAGDAVSSGKSLSLLKIAGNSAPGGDCSRTILPLQLSLSELGLKAAQVQEFRLTDFDYTVVKK